MSKISNVLTMIQLLSNGKKYSIKELSERLEVSKRMIRHYKEEIELAGIYIDTIRGPYGGYVLNQKIMLPYRSFSKYDIDLLQNIYDRLKDSNSFEFKRELTELIDKIKGVYKSNKPQPVNEILKDVNNKTKYNILNNTIKNKNKVFISFLSLNDDGKKRIIHPCHIYLYNNEFYVAAFCELRSEIRQKYKIIR